MTVAARITEGSYLDFDREAWARAARGDAADAR